MPATVALLLQCFLGSGDASDEHSDSHTRRGDRPPRPLILRAAPSGACSQTRVAAHAPGDYQPPTSPPAVWPSISADDHSPGPSVCVRPLPSAQGEHAPSVQPATFHLPIARPSRRGVWPRNEPPQAENADCGTLPPKMFEGDLPCGLAPLARKSVRASFGTRHSDAARPPPASAPLLPPLVLPGASAPLELVIGWCPLPEWLHDV
mmetsp:Transcript_43114/g.100481  ORF Transcript_43114/g.100481 Transcript_43114/m.100481 type:complete len:206 (+) Transcript_43114:117-734(+)